MNPMLRTILLHSGSVGAGAMAMLAFASSHSVDVYAIWNQLNVVVAEISKFIALATPLATAGYAAYKATTKNKLADIMSDPKAPQVAAAMPVTPQTVAVSNALKA